MSLLVAVGITYEFVLSNVTVFVAGLALGVALESWRRGRNHNV